MDSWPACHEFEPSANEDPSCREAMHVNSVESSNLLPLVWCGSYKRGMPSHVSSSSLDDASKLRVQLNPANLVTTSAGSIAFFSANLQRSP
ncbi:hypothetical protein TNCV_2434771 [Trichonephila clavipes]|nr:hypothetical protein TNCV_2434771 [Trichonephila clavipes]